MGCDVEIRDINGEWFENEKGIEKGKKEMDE